MVDWHLSHLKFLLENRADRSFIHSFLLNPRNGRKSLQHEDDAVNCAETILKQLAGDPEMKRLFTLFLVSLILISPSTCSSFKAWLKTRVNLSSIFPGLEWDHALAGTWVEVPILLTAQKVHVRYLVAGYFPGPAPRSKWPNWMEGLLDSSGMVSIETALRASASIEQIPANMSPYIYILSDRRFIKGSSLGLPLALSLSMLISGEKPSEYLIATGAITDSGRVAPVAHVEDKLLYAASSGFKVVLIPEDSSIGNSPETCEIYRVSTLEEARLFASLHRPGNARRLSVFSAIMRDPDEFIAASPTAEPEWLRWTVRRRPGAVSDTELVSTMARATALANALEKCANKEDLDRAEPIAALVDEDCLQLMELSSPSAAFKWCILNMALANHRGMIKKARTWNARAEAMMEKTPVIDFEWAVGYYNHMFVGFCHNLYCFIPDLPNYLGHVLEVVEDVYKSRLKFSHPKIVAYRPLGELCGSIAQNYGFCGPCYLQDVEIFTKKARHAFGAGRIPDLLDDCRRQFNYLVYSYLDAEKWDKAEEALCQYLEIASLSDFSKKQGSLSRWEHALLARFFADTGFRTESADYYYKKNSPRVSTLVEKRHPWQLWLNNMARLAAYRKDLERAAAWHRQSLDLCISDSSGPTIKMMGMLALAGLYQIGRLQKEDMFKAKEPITEALGVVDRNRFTALISAEFDEMPAIVAAEPNRYFPFSYR